MHRMGTIFSTWLNCKGKVRGVGLKIRYSIRNILGPCISTLGLYILVYMYCGLFCLIREWGRSEINCFLAPK